MQSSDTPKKISIPFSRDGDKRTIPNTSQIGITAGAASYPTGFPPQTFIAKENGGIPPAGVDFNGLFYDITTLGVWACSGGMYKYDAALSAQINGYPKGAQILTADATGVWTSTVENNTNNPDVTPTGWTRADLSSLSLTTGASRVGAADGSNLQQNLNRNPSYYGRVTLADLPKFGATVDQYRYDLLTPIYFVDFGSSVAVGADTPDPSTQAPGAVFAQMARNYFDPAGTLNIQHRNYAVNGTTISSFPAAWAAMVADGITPTVVFLAYGMNDQAPAQWNSGQTGPGFDDGLQQAIGLIKKSGADVVITTSPHAAVNNYPGYFSMPAGIPQNYPTFVAANVLPEQMNPPASQSLATGDFTGTGTSISVNKRALWINRKIRSIGAAEGCVVLDPEYFWFLTLSTNVAKGMTMAAAENLMFNAGEFVHPNLYGHMNSYGLASTYFWRSIGSQAAQHGAPRSVSGSFAVNPNNANPPEAALSVRTKYPDVTTHPGKIFARSGPVDVNGVKTEQLAFDIDNNGDTVLGELAAQGGEMRWTRVMTGGVMSYLLRKWTAYGVIFTEAVEGNPNTQTASPYVTRSPFPDNSVGKSLIIVGKNTGIGTSPQINRYTWISAAGVITLTAAGSTGSGVYTMTVSGLSLILTPVANNTNFTVHWEALS